MTSAADSAVDAFAYALDALLGELDAGELGGLPGDELVGVLRSFERVRNRMATLDHRLIGECDSRRLPERLVEPSTARMLVTALRLSPGEACRRVRAAKACGPRSSFTGEPLEPVRPVLAAAQEEGTVSAEQVDMIVRGLDGYDRPGFDPDAVTLGEQLLTGFAGSFGPQELRSLVARVVSAIDPDGSVPNDALNADRRHFSLRPTTDGAYVGEFRLTGAVGAKLKAVLDPLARPRCTSVREDGEPAVADLDPRTLPQRQHDALEEMCDRLLRSDTLPDTGGTPATVVVTISLDDLVRRVGAATTADGTPLSVRELLALADEAQIIPTVLNAAGAVLDQGRTKRLATPAQSLALNARDGGCSFPGCGQAPDWCERHHVVAWIDGGRTDLDNLTLLCRYHHHQFERRGWECRMRTDGLPEWIPPRWFDPDRRPLVHHRILVRQPQPDLTLAC